MAHIGYLTPAAFEQSYWQQQTFETETIYETRGDSVD